LGRPSGSFPPSRPASRQHAAREILERFAAWDRSCGTHRVAVQTQYIQPANNLSTAASRSTSILAGLLHGRLAV